MRRQAPTPRYPLASGRPQAPSHGLTRKAPSAGPRIVATLLLGFVSLVVSTTLFAWWSLGPLRLQPELVLVVAAGFRLPLWAAGLVTGVLGYLYDTLTGGILGLNLTAYMAVVVVCAVAQQKLEINSWPFQMAAVGVMSLVSQLLVVGGLSLAHRASMLPTNLAWVVAAQAVLSALTAPVFFALLEAVVRLIDRLWPASRGGKR